MISKKTMKALKEFNRTLSEDSKILSDIICSQKCCIKRQDKLLRCVLEFDRMTGFTLTYGERNYWAKLISDIQHEVENPLFCVKGGKKCV